jgi:hypothetical protein
MEVLTPFIQYPIFTGVRTNANEKLYRNRPALSSVGTLLSRLGGTYFWEGLY